MQRKNMVTTEPANLHPYHAAFAGDNGYLFRNEGYKWTKRTLTMEDDAEFDDTNEQNHNRNRNRNRNRNIQTPREKRLQNRHKHKANNLKLWKRNKRWKWNNRVPGGRTNRINRNRNRNINRNRNVKIRSEISHECGWNNCITTNHLNAESHSDNKGRSKCHKAIDRKARKLRRNLKKKWKNYYRFHKLYFLQLDDNDSTKCNHSPSCFRNYCEN